MYGGKLGNQSLVFPATSSVGVTQLVTPYFDLTCGANEGSTASVSLFIEAEGTVGDSLTIGFLYVDQTTQQEMAYLIESIPFETAQMSGQYTIDMFPVYSQMGFILQTNTALGNSGDVTLKKFIVSRPVSAGSQFASSYDYRMLTGATSADFNTMEKSLSEGVTDQFIYGVYALTLDMQQQQVTDASEVSNLIEVTSTSGVEGVQASNDKIFVHDNLHVVLEKPATIAVYNMAGVLVMSVEGVEGENEIALPAAGAYIVKAGNTVAKVMK